MEAVASAASIIAVIDLSAKIASLCNQYSSAVKNARSDIERFQRELERLKTTLHGARELLESPNGERLQTSHRLWGGLSDCSSQLTQLQLRLEKKLNHGTADKVMSRFGFRALKWPFESKEIDSIVKNLEQYRDILSLGLIVDQVTQVIDVAQTLALSKLPIANDAAFDSHADEHNGQCHPETRVDLLQDIKRWADDSQGECIFWLNGMAGTGKSTISRTIAQSFADSGLLGASFFFKRGERDRGNAALLFTTIAAQLIAIEPALASQVSAAIEADPAVTRKALKVQFEKLILKPLKSLRRSGTGDLKKIVLVVDALDECERDNDIRVIIYLLSQAKSLSSVHLRVFLTSRPELPIRLGFSNIKGKYQDLVLHEIPKPSIGHDVATFLDFELTKIRNDYNALSPNDRQLPPDWPGSPIVQALVDMAVPLFIFAATVIRFIRDPAWCDPDGQLAKVLEYRLGTQQSEIDKLDATYRPVLDPLLVSSEAGKSSLLDEFRTVVGSIVLLAEPLTIRSLACLLGIPENVVIRRLESLHSVLSVPASTKSPVRMFHLSFRDFLIDPDKCGSNPFWVNEKATNEWIATRCLELLSGHLKKDICDLRMPGTARADVKLSVIDSHLPTEIRYACLYWIYHVKQSSARIVDGHQVYIFLQSYFLQWLEALSLLGNISESIAMIRSLQDLTSPDTSTAVSAFLHDASRFILSFHQIVDLYPLQIYSSAIIFTPTKSVIRRLFESYIPGWISLLPNIDLEWNACLQILEGHNGYVNGVAFSPDGNTVASASYDRTVRLWDTATGAHRQTLEGHSGYVYAVAFSPDGSTIASASSDQTVRFWDTATGAYRRTLEGHSDCVNAVAFSLDGNTVASASSDQTVRFWNTVTGAHQQTLEGHSGDVWAVAFSPDGKIVASASEDRTIRFWDAITGAYQQTLKGHNGDVWAIAFSPDSSIVASASSDQTVRLWDTTTTSVYRQILKGHSGYVNAVVFSPDGSMIASASSDQTIRLWDTTTGAHQQTLKGHNGDVWAIAFLQDNSTVVSASSDRTVRLWDTTTINVHRQMLEGHGGFVNTVVFSPDGSTVASASSDQTICLWDATTGAHQQTLEGHSDCVNIVAFLQNGSMIASASSDRTVRLWDTATGTYQQILEGYNNKVSAIAFSPDNNTIASVSSNRIVQLWDTATGAFRQTLEGHNGDVWAIAFSPDGNTIASASSDQSLRFWDAATGAHRQTLNGHSGEVNAVVFSLNGSIVASASSDQTIRFWDATTGIYRQTLKGHSSKVNAIAFSPDSSTLASASSDHTIRLWDTAIGAYRQTLNGHSGEVNAVAFSPDGSIVASASEDRTVRLWDIVTGACRQTLKGHSDYINAVAFSPDGSILASASSDRTVRFWDAMTGAHRQMLEGHSSAVSALAFSSDGNTLASASGDRTIRLWDAATGTPRQMLELQSILTRLSFSENGHCLEIDRGLLGITSNPNTSSSSGSQKPASGFLLIDNDWVIRNGKSVLWLPADYRATCAGIHSQTLVLGHASGQVTFYRFASTE